MEEEGKAIQRDSRQNRDSAVKMSKNTEENRVSSESLCTAELEMEEEGKMIQRDSR